MKPIFILILSALFPVVAQTATLKGIVVDSETTYPIPLVNIVLQGTHRGTTTRLDGTFMLTGLPPGLYHISASSIGYATETSEVEVPEGGATIRIHLRPVTESLEEVVIIAPRHVSAASSTFANVLDWELRPRLSSQDLLRIAPGVVVAQHAGGGKAEQIFLRGFDADHGTDINISVDGIPINMVSHGHGQGYADLHFVMPEVLKGMEVYKGPYYAQFGDFGTAGTVTFTTLDALEHSSLTAEAGSFGMRRYVGLGQLPLPSASTRSYVAGEYLVTDGYFERPQNFVRKNAFGKVVHEFDGAQVLTFWASAFESSWDASGQIPERAVKSRTIGRFGSIDPSEGGATSRYNMNLSFTTGAATWNLTAQAYYSRYRFRLVSNFTFFKVDPLRGDAIEQVDDRSLAGGRLEFATENDLFGFTGTTTLGLLYREDEADLELWHVANRSRLQNRVLAHVRQHNFSAFGTHDLKLGKTVRFQLGFRGEYFVFAVDDRNSASTVPTPSGRTTQFIANPKANLIVSPSATVDLFANFGMGFHSNDARVVLEKRGSPTLPLAAGAEIGLRVSPSRGLTLSAALWSLDLEREFVYSGDEGTTEEKGPTRRLGFDADMRIQLLSCLWGDVDLTWSRGRFMELATGEDFIPLAPTFSSSGGLTLLHPAGFEGSIRFRHIASRPADEQNVVRAWAATIFDVSFGYRIGPIGLRLVVGNIFDSEWNESQFSTESQLRDEVSPVTELHFTPGSPRSFRVKAELKW